MSLAPLERDSRQGGPSTPWSDGLVSEGGWVGGWMGGELTGGNHRG